MFEKGNLLASKAIRDISLPFLFKPREYQKALMTQVPRHYSRGVFIWHRRAGKDLTAWNHLVVEAIKKKAIYYYFFPTYKQGRKALWEALSPSTGVRFLEHIPKELIANKNDTEMKITLVNGSIIRVVGTDDYDSIVGTNPYGCVFSEYALQDPRAWNFVRPILTENKGWAVFISTPRGRNHMYTLYRMAQASPEWYTETLSYDKTKREDGTPVISEKDIEREREEGMFEELIQQEYKCSFEGYVQGAYYSKQIEEARGDNPPRITALPYVEGFSVHTAWDLGYDDSTSIWFFQVINQQFRFIDYYENCGQGWPFYVKVLKDKPYVYGDHYMPHDVAVHEKQSGKTHKEFFEELDIRPIIPVSRPRNSDVIILECIPKVRGILSQCWFDKTKCSIGLSSLESYHAEYDEEKKVLSNRPAHDISSHAADAFRTFVMGFKPKGKKARSVSQMMEERKR